MKKQVALWLKWPHEQYFPLFEKVSGFIVKSLMVTMLGCDIENISKEANILRGNLDNVCHIGVGCLFGYVNDW